MLECVDMEAVGRVETIWVNLEDREARNAKVMRVQIV
jgi:hypothetical protein